MQSSGNQMAISWQSACGILGATRDEGEHASERSPVDAAPIAIACKLNRFSLAKTLVGIVFPARITLAVICGMSQTLAKPGTNPLASALEEAEDEARALCN